MYTHARVRTHTHTHLILALFSDSEPIEILKGTWQSTFTIFVLEDN